jgi:DNA polymerase elongation subunit (family B)
MGIIAENKDMIDSVAKEKLISEQKGYVNSLVRQLNERRSESKVLNDMINDIFPNHLLNRMKKQLYVNLYLNQLNSKKH